MSSEKEATTKVSAHRKRRGDQAGSRSAREAELRACRRVQESREGVPGGCGPAERRLRRPDLGLERLEEVAGLPRSEKGPERRRADCCIVPSRLVFASSG